jgi:predicted DNA-binding transcriptional regulator YafY
MLTEKANILCILDILKKYSDPGHILSVSDILKKMKAIYDVKAERRTVYRNIDALIEFGYDISKYDENKEGYFLRERELEPSEIHMLCDAVLSAECISKTQEKELIKKLQNLGSIHQTKAFSHLGMMKSEKQAPNPQLFYNIDLLDEAISRGRKVEFDYYIYDTDLKQKSKREKKYATSPYSMYWSMGRYYLISGLEQYDNITHFRLDRIRNLSITEDAAKPPPEGFHPYEYASKTLFMFGGEVENYTICCERRILQDVIDRFGDKIIITKSDEDTFTAIVKATTGGMRLWAIHYLETCRVLSPEWLVDEVKEAIRKGVERYGMNTFIL